MPIQGWRIGARFFGVARMSQEQERNINLLALLFWTVLSVVWVGAMVALSFWVYEHRDPVPVEQWQDTTRT